MSTTIRNHSLKRVYAFITTNTIEMARRAVSSSFAMMHLKLYLSFCSSKSPLNETSLPLIFAE